MKAVRIALVVAMLPILTPSLSQAAESEMLEHPTNYPHRHVKRRVRRVRPRRSTSTSSPATRRTSAYFGLGVLGNFFLDTGDNISRVYQGGGGFDILGGFRMNEAAALEFNYFAAFQSTKEVDGSNVRNGSLQGFTFGGKIYLAPNLRRLEPFFQLGIGLYMLSEELKERLSGVGVNIGGGIDIRISPYVAVGTRLMYRGFYVDNSDAHYNAVATESAFLNTLSLSGNIQFHF